MMRKLAVTVGLLAGFVILIFGLGGISNLNRNDSFFDRIVIFIYTFSLVPLSVLGIFRPGAAARLILASIGLYVAWCVYQLGRELYLGQQLGWYPFPFLIFVIPGSLVALILLRASRRRQDG